MSISNIGPGASLAPTVELPVREASSKDRRAAAAQPVDSLPGNSEREDAEGRLLSREAAKISGFGETIDRRMQFVVEHQSNEVIVKVIDNATDEVVKVLPPEELQRLPRNDQETTGFLLNERV